MKTKTKVVVVTLVIATVGFLTEPHSPFGSFWAPSSMVPDPVGLQIPLFVILGITESLALGLAVSFLLFGYPTLKAGFPVSVPLTRAAHLSTAWFLGNWWAHDSLHLHVGMDLNSLLFIEYGFHVTLIIAGVILVLFFLAVVRALAAQHAGVILEEGKVPQAQFVPAT